MLKTKKLYRLMAGLLAALMICASVPSVAYATEGGAEETGTTVIMKIAFKDGDETVAGGDYFVPQGVNNYSVLEEYVPEGYEMTVSGDFTASEGGELEVSIQKISTDVTMNIIFKAGNEVIAGGDYIVPAGVQNYSVLEQYVPEGYEMTVSGDFTASEGGKLEVGIQKISTDVTMNIVFKAGNEVIAGGDYTVPAGVQNYSVLEQYVPEGYEMTVSGDFTASEGGKLEVGIQKISTDVTMNIVFKAGNEVVAGGDYTVPAGVQNYSVLEQYVPEGYEMTVSGDFTASEGGKLEVGIQKISTDVTMNIVFKAGNEVVAGGDYTVPAGVQNYSVLEQYVPEGYEMTVSGDFTASEGGKLEVSVVKKETEEPDDTIKEVIMNIQFVTADGEVAGGGDYFLPEGVQNYSVLNQYLPEGYKLAVSGDFFVKEGESIEVRVEKIAEDIIMNISFKDGEEVVGGGDYFVPAGVQNYSVLEQYVPEGYRMTVSGDFMAEAGAHLDVSVEKTEKDVIMNIRFVTADGTFVSGGDYFLPEGIQNFSILEQYVPVGYQMLESGDFTVVEGGKEDVTVEKISDEVIVNISFIDRYGNVIAGGDYFVPEGIQNRNVLDRYVPDGYTQAETGDINFTAGGHYDIVLDEATSIVNIQFIDRESKEVVAGGDYTVPTGIHNRSILNQYVPEGYRQVVTGDIEFIYGQHYEILIEKDTAIVNIRFIDRDGNFIAGGDYFVPLGIVNRSVLDQYVPEGYRQAVTGDIEFVAGGEYEIIIEKIAENVVSKTAIFRKGETDIWNENPDNPDEVHYTFFSDDKTATCIVPSVTVADETKELDYWVSDVDGTVKLYPGQAFCYNDLDKGELEGYAGDFAFYPVYKDKTVEEPTDPGTEEPANPGTGDPSTPGNGGSNSGNSNGSSGSGSGSSASKSDAPADNSSKILPKTGYGENTIPTAGITAVSLAAVCGAAGYAFIARRRVR